MKMAGEPTSSGLGRPWRLLFRGRDTESTDQDIPTSEKPPKPTWTMGILNDRETIEVPGSVLLLSKERNEPLGLRNQPARTSHSSLPTGMLPEPPMSPVREEQKKLTSDGQIILDPQPDDSHNDPLNWPAWRRDCALLSLGLFSMVGGGITPIIAAGFTDVAHDFNVDISQVSLTTGLYMLGLGLGCVIFSPTAILYGKRPVYLFGSILFILSAVWCALSPSFTSLILARIFQGIAVSPVECLPSATIAEIFFLHERAFRIGIYTLLLLGGKNLVPLVSAVIINALDWRWVFWIVAIVVGFCGILLFLFVPETFWDRTPIPKSQRRVVKRPSFFSRRSSARHAVPRVSETAGVNTTLTEKPTHETSDFKPAEEKQHMERPGQQRHVGFAPEAEEHPTSEARLGDHDAPSPTGGAMHSALPSQDNETLADATKSAINLQGEDRLRSSSSRPPSERAMSHHSIYSPKNITPAGSHLHSPNLHDVNSALSDHLSTTNSQRDPEAQRPAPHRLVSDTDSERMSFSNLNAATMGQVYTHRLREAPRQSFKSQLRIFHGRINQDKWWKAAVRPFILYSYPAVLWSSAVYACSVGWLIVISECVAVIYREGYYEFDALQTGLVYIAPFVGGVLGTGVAGRVSDIIVKAMARRNGGLYEPEFRLVMAIPITITTVIGLIGFGWSAQAEDPWIVPTVFFGVVSFGCSLGSTTAITFCVDSYRQYAGEALVTLNFSKNVLHGLVFSFFVTGWLKDDGSKSVFVWIGVIQLIVLLSTIPMYIYGKRARMWTVRMNFMEKF
ncbi:major facilitator superfamily domain-containing protein [Xylaria bambusicola]|uniref:major facilitator superfamily domain-containing protein n=1 Tax=Xylaria bambusicola TaxID=326684 RepID=UPI002008C1C2|nr:major facilitator superfamily domain-containing protein [Xylaria bambusicola]KAI0521149.1 major facilitator superfamily domain-containing protein [Xylaria bambusicola]